MKEVHKSWQLFFFFCWYSISFLSNPRVQFERELAVHGGVAGVETPTSRWFTLWFSNLEQDDPEKKKQKITKFFSLIYLFLFRLRIPGAQVRLTPSLCHTNVLLSLLICTMSRHFLSFFLEPLITVNRPSSLQDRMRHQGSFSVAKQTQPPQKRNQRPTHWATREKGNFCGADRRGKFKWKLRWKNP
jgi:hypothetical protein